MENAVDALKMAFGVLVFAVAVALLFQTASLARSVADSLIKNIDETTYYNYYEHDETIVDERGNRIVTMEDIIPAIYRYSTENYGITIIQNKEIVARFDKDTETLCSNWYDSNVTDETKDNLVKELNDYVLLPVGANGLIRSAVKDDLELLFRKIYAQDTNNYVPRVFDCPWSGNDELISQRIDSDLSRNKSIF